MGAGRVAGLYNKDRRYPQHTIYNPARRPALWAINSVYMDAGRVAGLYIVCWLSSVIPEPLRGPKGCIP